jgi:hypothetical protein
MAVFRHIHRMKRERAVALAPGLQDAWEAVSSRVPFCLRGGSDTFFPVRSQRSW